MLQTIQAKKLASGDRVYFPRKKAKIRVGRIVARYSAIRQTAFSFDDGITRYFDDTKKLSVEIAAELPDRKSSELYRLDLAADRISIITEDSFTFGFSEFFSAFRQLPKRIGALPASDLLEELRNGATFHTSEAVYSKDRSAIGAIAQRRF